MVPIPTAADIFAVISLAAVKEIAALPEGHDYLTALQRHANQVVAAPAIWLPWNYQAQLAST